MSVHISYIHPKAVKHDRDLNAEFVKFTNQSDSAVDLSDWSIWSDSEQKYQLPSGTELPPYEIDDAHTG